MFENQSSTNIELDAVYQVKKFSIVIVKHVMVGLLKTLLKISTVCWVSREYFCVNGLHDQGAG